MRRLLSDLACYCNALLDCGADVLDELVYILEWDPHGGGR